jgi:hypothetical protein
MDFEVVHCEQQQKKKTEKKVPLVGYEHSATEGRAPEHRIE